MATVTFAPAPYAPAGTLTEPFDGKTSFPLSLRPVGADKSARSLASSIGASCAQGEIRRLLNHHGAIYFQNLGLSSAKEFSEFAHAFGWKPHEDIGNPVRRTVLAENVATANEGPNTQPVYPHNEFALSPHYPAYVLFYCASAPETGVFSCSAIPPSLISELTHYRW
jgi:hypothetical protein